MYKRVPRLTARDERILRYILENRFATATRIARLFFPSQTTNAHQRRLRRLRELKYVEAKTFRYAPRVYCLSKKGLARMRELGMPSEFFRQARRIDPVTIYYEELLQDLRAAFEKFPTVSKYLTRRHLSAQRSVPEVRKRNAQNSYTPDARFTWRCGDRVFQIFLSVIRYSTSKQYREETLTAMAFSSSTNVVFILARTSEIVSLWKETLQSMRNAAAHSNTSIERRGFYFATFDEILISEGGPRLEGEGISVRFAAATPVQPLVSSMIQPPKAVAHQTSL